jgi:hypothetical protein
VSELFGILLCLTGKIKLIIAKRETGRELRGAWCKDELIGGKLPVVK